MIFLLASCRKWIFLFILTGFLSGCFSGKLDRRNPAFSSCAKENKKQSTPCVFLQQLGTVWYGVYYNDRKVGWGKVTKKLGSGFLSKSNSMQILLNSQIRMQVNGATLEIESRVEENFSSTPPYEVNTYHYRNRVNDYLEEKEIRKTDQGYQIKIAKDGSESEKNVKHMHYTLQDTQKLEEWLIGNPKKGDRTTFNFFNPKKMKVKSANAVLTDVKTNIENGRSVKRYHISKFPEEDLSGMTIYSENLQLQQDMYDYEFQIRMEPAETVRNIPDDEDIYVRLMARIDSTIGKSDEVKTLQLSLDPLSGSLIENSPGQKIEKGPNNNYILTLDPEQIGAEKVTQADRIQFKMLSREMREVEDTLREIVPKTVNVKKTRKERVESLLEFVDDYIEDATDVFSPNLKYILKNKKGDCSEHATLFKALARVHGIPCRRVTGLVYLGDWAKCFGLHAWNEVEINGFWQPVDPIEQEIMASPLYIRFPLSETKRSKLEANIPKMKIEIITVTLQ